jgi:hypothetical protein
VVEEISQILRTGAADLVQQVFHEVAHRPAGPEVDPDLKDKRDPQKRIALAEDRTRKTLRVPPAHRGS